MRFGVGGVAKAEREGVTQPRSSTSSSPLSLHPFLLPLPPPYLLEVVQAKLLVLDVGMVGNNRSCRPGVQPQDHLPRHHRLGLPHVAGAEKKLPVEIGDVDSVQVDDLHLLEARQHQVFE